MFKPINYGYNDSKGCGREGSKEQQSDLIVRDLIVRDLIVRDLIVRDLIVGKSLLNTQCQYKLNDDKPILEFIKIFREDKNKTNLITGGIYLSTK
jgi:hypothetical protein